MSTPFDNPSTRQERAETQHRRKAKRQIVAARTLPKKRGPRDPYKASQQDSRSAPPKGRWLYRMYSAEDTLLYVGITDRGHKREREHKRTKPWFEEVHHMTYQRYTTRAELEHAERVAIKGERPKYNIIHNGKG